MNKEIKNAFKDIEKIIVIGSSANEEKRMGFFKKAKNSILGNVEQNKEIKNAFKDIEKIIVIGSSANEEKRAEFFNKAKTSILGNIIRRGEAV